MLLSCPGPLDLSNSFGTPMTVTDGPNGDGAWCAACAPPFFFSSFSVHSKTFMPALLYTLSGFLSFSFGPSSVPACWLTETLRGFATSQHVRSQSFVPYSSTISIMPW